jgi:hypothetical protein
MGANGRRIREDKEQPAEHAERRRKRNSCQRGNSVSVSIRGQLPKKWLAAHSGGDGSRHARRPAQERAAPTAFQRTSLLMKCNTPRRDCESFFCRCEQIIGKTLARGRNTQNNADEGSFSSVSASICVFCGQFPPPLSFCPLAAKPARKRLPNNLFTPLGMSVSCFACFLIPKGLHHSAQGWPDSERAYPGRLRLSQQP